MPDNPKLMSEEEKKKAVKKIMKRRKRHDWNFEFMSEIGLWPKFTSYLGINWKETEAERAERAAKTEKRIPHLPRTEETEEAVSSLSVDDNGTLQESPRQIESPQTTVPDGIDKRQHRIEIWLKIIGALAALATIVGTVWMIFKGN